MLNNEMNYNLKYHPKGNKREFVGQTRIYITDYKLKQEKAREEKLEKGLSLGIRERVKQLLYMSFPDEELIKRIADEYKLDLKSDDRVVIENILNQEKERVANKRNKEKGIETDER